VVQRRGMKNRYSLCVVFSFLRLKMITNGGLPLWVVIGCVVFLYISRLILTEVSRYQAEPYMDEIFHISQAQKYCAGLYSEVR